MLSLLIPAKYNLLLNMVKLEKTPKFIEEVPLTEPSLHHKYSPFEFALIRCAKYNLPLKPNLLYKGCRIQVTNATS